MWFIGYFYRMGPQFSILISVLGFLCLGTDAFGFDSGLTGLYGGFSYVKSMFGENCDENFIKYNKTELAKLLSSSLHGQHMVQKAVLHNMRLHFASDNPAKPLAMSFHGWTGGGKNFVSQMIVDSIYKEKKNSKYVHWIVGSIHFPHQHRLEQYKDQLISWIQGNVSQCEHSIFIFDEVDKMPVGLLDTVKPFLDYYENIQGTDFRKSIFIFLSNTGGTAITEKFIEYWEQGRNRDEIRIDDFHDLIELGAFNEKIENRGWSFLIWLFGSILKPFRRFRFILGGLYRSSMIEKNLIDYYIPFLPLERQHVKLCARDELVKIGVTPTNEILNEIAGKMPYFPDDKKLFSKIGCKRVKNKVQEYLYRDEL